jgi:hypothetical protein
MKSLIKMKTRCKNCGYEYKELTDGYCDDCLKMAMDDLNEEE